MPVLFSPSELTAYLQRPVPAAQYDTAHMLTLDAITGETAGRLTDPPQPGVKSVALAVAARSLTNPGGLRSAAAGGVSESYTDALTGAVLTAQEVRRVRRAVGLAGGASSLDIGPDDPPRRYVYS
ncbi:hypothetical protein [Kitasatospora sp. NPDC101183]|uniref:hypothetical protein n=1 Tax=Kitasatospora sp. NPDC101183 TaxID=3364100 RepID=UPI0038015772